MEELILPAVIAASSYIIYLDYSEKGLKNFLDFYWKCIIRSALFVAEIIKNDN